MELVLSTKERSQHTLEAIAQESSEQQEAKLVEQEAAHVEAMATLMAQSGAELASATAEGVAAREQAGVEHERKLREELSAQREQMARETQEQIKSDRAAALHAVVDEHQKELQLIIERGDAMKQAQITAQDDAIRGINERHARIKSLQLNEHEEQLAALKAEQQANVLEATAAHDAAVTEQLKQLTAMKISRQKKELLNVLDQQRKEHDAE